MARPYYLYLTEESWIDAWISGGDVPINPASAYLSTIREGTKTPDETLQKSIEGMPDWVVGGDNRAVPPFRVHPGGDLTLRNLVVVQGSDVAQIESGRATNKFEDGLILSLSTRLDSMIAERLRKKACVQIRCMACLIEALDEQIGAHCKWGRVRYRDGYARNHFLKSAADSWQDEYRLLWRTEDVSPRTVTLPPNMAQRVFWNPC
jgi:hypothetical protein